MLMRPMLAHVKFEAADAFICSSSVDLYKHKPSSGHWQSTAGYPELVANQDLVMILVQQL